MAETLPYVIHRSSVNAWECDENGHLNVRHFIGKNYQGLTHLFAELGLTPAALRDLGGSPRVVSQHIRFHREAIQGMPITILGQLVERRNSRLSSYTELRHSQENTLFTSFNTEVDIVELKTRQPCNFDLNIDISSFDVPQHGIARSLLHDDMPVASVGEALELGYVETGRGTVLAEECDEHGYLEFYQYAAQIADAIPNFMSTIQSANEFALRSAGELGGAVIESRADYYNTLECGSRFVILSGVRSFTAKTKRLSHLIFDLDNELLIKHSQGIAVALDLNSRRAVPFSEDRLKRMQSQQLKG